MVFSESKAFTRRLAVLAGDSADQVLRPIHNDFIRDPECGKMVQGLGGIRKARVAEPTRGKGTGGGYRYVHLYSAHRDHIHLVAILDKDEQEDLDTTVRIALR